MTDISKFTTSDGLGLAYADTAETDKPPVLCLAGLTRNMDDFEPFMAAHGDAYRYIRLDSRGRGLSDYDENFMNYSVPVEARDAVELIAHLGLQKVVIVGTSRGGLLAMAIAATVPQLLAGVLLNDIGPELEQAGLDPIMGYLGRKPVSRSLADAAETMAALNAETFPDLGAEDWLPHVAKWYTETDNGLELKYDAKLRDAVLATDLVPGADLWPFFHAFDAMPLAVLRGANSDLISAQGLQNMVEAREDLIWAEVPNRAHVPFLDEAESIDVFTQLMGRIEW